MSILAAPDWGGIHAVIERTTPYIVSSGFERIVVCPTVNAQVLSRLTTAGAKVISYAPQRPRKTFDPRAHLAYMLHFTGDIRSYVSLLESERADLVEVVGLLNLQPVFAGRRAKVPVVWQLHSTLAPRGVRFALGSLTALYSDVVMTSGAGMISRHGGLSLNRDRVIPFCAPLDLDSFRSNEDSRRVVRRAWGYSEQDIVVGTLGNRGWQKHHEMLVRVAHALRGKDVRLKFAIVGTDLPGNKDYYERSVRGLVLKNGLHLDGYVKIIDQDRSAPEVLNAFDVFALTSVAEGASLVTAEAMATSLPIISTDVGSLNDVVVPDRNGYLVELDDVRGMSEVVVRLLDAEKRREMGWHSRRIVEQQTSIEKCAAAHTRAYEIAFSMSSKKNL